MKILVFSASEIDSGMTLVMFSTQDNTPSARDYLQEKGAPVLKELGMRTVIPIIADEVVVCRKNHMVSSVLSASTEVVVYG